MMILQLMDPRTQCLCISTDPKDDPADPAIEIPWAPDGSARTGLLEFSRVVLLWHVWIESIRFEKTTGFLTNLEIENIRQKREIALTFKPSK
jgi:hypothetical protein